jgi:citrate lyase beta subunit
MEKTLPAYASKDVQEIQMAITPYRMHEIVHSRAFGFSGKCAIHPT